MDPGNVILTTSIAHCVYDAEGREDLRVTYKPNKRGDCFVLISLGTMPKGRKPAEHAMRVLQELGWTPPSLTDEEA